MILSTAALAAPRVNESRARTDHASLAPLEPLQRTVDTTLKVVVRAQLACLASARSSLHRARSARRIRELLLPRWTL